MKWIIGLDIIHLEGYFEQRRIVLSQIVSDTKYIADKDRYVQIYCLKNIDEKKKQCFTPLSN